MSKHYLFLGIVAVLVAVGIGLAFFVYYKQSSAKALPRSLPVIEDIQSDSAPDRLPDFLSESDRKLLTPLPKDITSTLYRQQYQALVAAAKSGTKIEIKQCFGVPTVLKILSSKKTTITFANSDSQSHSIYLLGKKYNLPAKGSMKIIAQNNKVGMYEYKCDNFTIFTGLIYVAEK